MEPNCQSFDVRFQNENHDVTTMEPNCQSFDVRFQNENHDVTTMEPNCQSLDSVPSTKIVNRMIRRTTSMQHNGSKFHQDPMPIGTPMLTSSTFHPEYSLGNQYPIMSKNVENPVKDVVTKNERHLAPVSNGIKPFHSFVVEESHSYKIESSQPNILEETYSYTTTLDEGFNTDAEEETNQEVNQEGDKEIDEESDESYGEHEIRSDDSLFDNLTECSSASMQSSCYSNDSFSVDLNYY
mmetsp:Transcript_7130/g.15451  ORF Transcript_7130/g.15451 Transcript_7130/m.15451 type:complete len:239 (-) Transcript_7130:93-809(-)